MRVFSLRRAVRHTSHPGRAMGVLAAAGNGQCSMARWRQGDYRGAALFGHRPAPTRLELSATALWFRDPFSRLACAVAQTAFEKN